MRLDALVGGSVDVVGPEASLRSAANLMVDGGTGAVAVVGRRELVGILTDRDLARAVAAGADLESEVAEDWMSEAPDVFAPDVQVGEAAAWLLETGYRHLPVVAGDELLGIVDVRDLLWALTQT
jgi:CBS domain-containing protein